MPPLVIAGLALAAAKVVKGVVDKNKANKIKAEFTPYKPSPYAESQLATARQMFNGRMAGAAAEERNIDTSQASYNDFIDRNASSGAQALALGATGQSKANEAYGQLAIREQQNKYGLLANLNQAYHGMANEDNKVYQSKMEKYYMDTNQKKALNTSGDANIFGGISDGISMGMIMQGGGASGGGISNIAGYGNGAGAGFGNGVQSSGYPSFAGPANTFNNGPSMGGFQLWYPPKQTG